MNDLVERMTEIVKNEERFSLDEVWKWFIEGEDIFVIEKTEDTFRVYRDLFKSNAQKKAYLFI